MTKYKISYYSDYKIFIYYMVLVSLIDWGNNEVKGGISE